MSTVPAKKSKESKETKYIRYCLTCDPKMRCRSKALKEIGACARCGETNDYFSCPNCKVCKEKQNTMYYHISKCTGTTKHNCEHCDFKTTQKATLELHMQSKHPEEVDTDAKKFCCPWRDCPFSSLTAGNLRIHFLRIHFAKYCADALEREEGSSCHDCKLCDREFNSSTSFYYHIGPCLIASNQLNMMQEEFIEKVL
jgi:hypothetical protein